MNRVLFSSVDDYLDFVVKLAKNNKTDAIENIESRWGVRFGTDEENEADGEALTLDAIKVSDKERLPEKYPCLMIYCDDRGFDRHGPFRVAFEQFVYLSDFEQ